MPLTEEQLAIRKTGIGASEVAAIMGLGKYEGPLEVWERKVGLGTEYKGNRWTLFGNVLEPVAAQLYADLYLADSGITLLESTDLPNSKLYDNVADGTFRRADVEWALCTPDRVWSDMSRVVEIKAPGHSAVQKDWAWKRVVKAPIDYVVQVRYQTWFFKFPENGHLVPLMAGNNLKVFEIVQRDDFEDEMLDALDEFWFWVKRQTPNPIWEPKTRPEFEDGDPLPASAEEAKAMILVYE